MVRNFFSYFLFFCDFGHEWLKTEIYPLFFRSYKGCIKWWPFVIFVVVWPLLDLTALTFPLFSFSIFFISFSFSSSFISSSFFLQNLSVYLRKFETITPRSSLLLDNHSISKSHRAPLKSSNNLTHLTNADVCWKNNFLKISGNFDDGNHR